MKDLIIENVKGTGDTHLAASVARFLAKQFPGYQWQVRLNDSALGGVMEIHNKTIQEHLPTHTDYGYILKLSTVYADPSLRCVLMAGGEILERAGISTNRNTGDIVKSVEGVKIGHQPYSHQLKTLGLIL